MGLTDDAQIMYDGGCKVFALHGQSKKSCLSRRTIALRVESDELMGGDSELLLAREWKSLAVPPYLQGGRMSMIIPMGMLLIQCRPSRNGIFHLHCTTEKLFVVVFQVKRLLSTWTKATVI